MSKEEDKEDLKIIEDRKNEPTISLAKFKGEIKKIFRAGATSSRIGT